MHATATHYTLGAPPVSGAGFGVAAVVLDEALAGPVAAVVFRFFRRGVDAALGEVDF